MRYSQREASSMATTAARAAGATSIASLSRETPRSSAYAHSRAATATKTAKRAQRFMTLTSRRGSEWISSMKEKKTSPEVKMRFVGKSYRGRPGEKRKALPSREFARGGAAMRPGERQCLNSCGAAEALTLSGKSPVVVKRKNAGCEKFRPCARQLHS